MDPSFHTIDVQDNLVHHMMCIAINHGWTQDTLERAVVQAGIPLIQAPLVFEGNLDKALDHFIDLMDRQFQAQINFEILKQMKVRDRILWLVCKRLEILTPYRLGLRQVLSYQSHPLRWQKTLPRLFQTVSDLWYSAGDQATDFNYYTKRMLLAGVYGSTFLYWLKDESPQFMNTHSFLQRRIDQVMKISSIKRRVTSFFRFAKAS